MNNFFDIIIIGAGPAGAALAASLADRKFKIAVIDKKNLLAPDDAVQDKRTTAIAQYSKQILDKLNLWGDLEREAGVIEQIRITDNDSSLFLHFDNNLIDKLILGYIVDNHQMISLFHQKISNAKSIEFFCGNVKDIENSIAHVELTVNEQQLQTSLLIVADGRMSKTREKLKFQTEIKDYGHTAMIGFVEHELPHNNIAIEKFYSKMGPFAVLPLKNQHNSNIIWTEEHKAAQALMQLDEERKKYFLKSKFGDHWGELNLISKLYSYPLNLVQVSKYYKNRILLFGDAAHGIHPIAGQGYNLTIRDLAELHQLLIKHKEIGTDIGSEIFLEEFEQKRRADNNNMIVITDLLNRLFLCENKIISKVRQFGLGAINRLPILQKFFMNYAAGKR